MPPEKISSIKNYVVYYSMVIFVVVFLAAALHYFTYSRYLQNVDRQQQVKSLEHSAASVARLLDFYQSVVDKIAQQHAVVDLLQFGSGLEVQQWAGNMQRLLPESIGLALFDSDGSVKGDRTQLRLSDRCFADMQRRFDGLPVARPPVHYKIEHLAHFDIVSPVMVDGENIGLVFASFSLNTIENLLANLDMERHLYQVITAENYIVGSAGIAAADQGELFEILIPKTDWTMKMWTIESDKQAFFASLLVSNIVTFILVSAVLFIAIKRLFSMVVSDFETLSWMMHRIKSEDFDSSKLPVPHLAETAGVVRFMQYAAEELNGYQKKLKRESTTDELTGLFNRRVLNERIDRFIDRANEGHKNYLVILDLDYFKAINDNHGHELGDKVLKLFSEALLETCKKTDVCTRTGGDEFIALLVDYEGDEITLWYEKLSSRVQGFMASLRNELKIESKLSVSAGCTLIRVSDNRSALLKRADRALYEVKGAGRNNIFCG